MFPGHLILYLSGVCYVAYFLVSWFAWKADQLNIDGRNGLLCSLKGINTKHLAGIFLLGLPLLLYRGAWLGLLAFPRAGSLKRMLAVLLLAIIAGQLALAGAKKRSRNPVMITGECRRPGFGEICRYLIVRSVFLIVYECFFRGLLLAACLRFLGIPAAILINLACYAGLHLFRGFHEMLPCIFFGLTLCGVVLWNHSVLPALVIHLVLSLVYETCLFFLPQYFPKTFSS
jgi:hypothetical protein